MYRADSRAPQRVISVGWRTFATSISSVVIFTGAVTGTFSTCYVDSVVIAIYSHGANTRALWIIDITSSTDSTVSRFAVVLSTLIASSTEPLVPARACAALDTVARDVDGTRSALARWERWETTKRTGHTIIKKTTKTDGKVIR